MSEVPVYLPEFHLRIKSIRHVDRIPIVDKEVIDWLESVPVDAKADASSLYVEDEAVLEHVFHRQKRWGFVGDHDEIYVDDEMEILEGYLNDRCTDGLPLVPHPLDGSAEA